MANKQYQKGVRLEREVVNLYKKVGGKATRSAGSHGWVDVTAEFKYRYGSTIQDYLPGFIAGMGWIPGRQMVLSRVGKKYIDTLYIDEYCQTSGTSESFVEGESVVHLIQCKRKEVKWSKSR